MKENTMNYKKAVWLLCIWAAPAMAVEQSSERAEILREVRETIQDGELAKQIVEIRLTREDKRPAAPTEGSEQTKAVDKTSRGYFLQGTLGRSKLTYLAMQNGYTGQTSDTTGSIGGGYRFDDYFGLETAYRNFGSLKITANTSGGLTGSDVGYVKAFTAGGFVALPLGSSFELTARAGWRRWQMKEEWQYSTGLNGNQTIVGTDGYGGVGISFPLHKNLKTVINVTRFKSPSVNVKTGGEVEIGLQYRFGNAD